MFVTVYIIYIREMIQVKASKFWLNFKGPILNIWFDAFSDNEKHAY